MSDPEDPEAVDDVDLEPLPDDVEVPEADAIEQRRPLAATPAGVADLPELVDEADALDQARVVDIFDEDDLRDPM